VTWHRQPPVKIQDHARDYERGYLISASNDPRESLDGRLSGGLLVKKAAQAEARVLGIRLGGWLRRSAPRLGEVCQALIAGFLSLPGWRIWEPSCSGALLRWELVVVAITTVATQAWGRKMRMLALLLGLVTLAACGDVLFIPAPPVANSGKVMAPPPPQNAGSPHSPAAPSS
jgi:hypothetical protein